MKTIETITRKYGHFLKADVSSETSYIIKSNNHIKQTHYLEMITKYGIYTEEWRDLDKSLDSTTIPYDELDEETLSSILNLCILWEQHNYNKN